jgi:hypothetical protein
MFEKTRRKLAATWRKRSRQPEFYIVSKPNTHLTGGQRVSPVGSRRWSLATETTSLLGPILAANQGAEVYYLAKSSNVSHLKLDTNVDVPNLDAYPRQMTIQQEDERGGNVANAQSRVSKSEERNSSEAEAIGIHHDSETSRSRTSSSATAIAAYIPEFASTCFHTAGPESSGVRAGHDYRKDAELGHSQE